MSYHVYYYITEMRAQKEALLGRKLISNHFSRPAEPADFKSISWLEDDALPKGACKPILSVATEFSALSSERLDN